MSARRSRDTAEALFGILRCACATELQVAASATDAGIRIALTDNGRGAYAVPPGPSLHARARRARCRAGCQHHFGGRVPAARAALDALSRAQIAARCRRWLTCSWESEPAAGH